MEELEELKKALKNFSKAMPGLEINLSNHRNEVESLTAKKKDLREEIEKLEKSRNDIDSQVQADKKNRIEEIDAKYNEANRIKGEAEVVLRDAQKRATEVARESLEARALKDEYTGKLAELDQKEARLNERLRAMEEFTSKIR